MSATDSTAATTAAPPAACSAEQTLDLLERAAALRWWQTTAFVEVAGPDAASLLDGLCTQAVERIEVATGRLGLFLDAKAKVIAPAVLHRVADSAWTDPRRGDAVETAPRLLLETLPELVEPLRSHLAKYRLRARATIEPIALSTIALVGPEAARADDGGAWSTVLDAHRPTVALLGSAQACADATARHGESAADPDTVEADRIEAGVAWLHDLLPGRMPAEVGGMEAAVALDAGCYLGQEPVARLHYRGHANRTLRRLEAPAGTELRPGSGDPDEALALRRPGDAADARPIGRLTTWATAPDGRVVALATARREVAAGDELACSGGSPVFVARDDAPA